MKTTQTWIRNVLRAVVLLGVLGVGGAWGQELKKIDALKGCSFFMTTSTNKLPVVLKSEGRCVNGLATGDWVYAAHLWRLNDEFDGIFARTFANGKVVGMSLTLAADFGSVMVYDPSYTNAAGNNLLAGGLFFDTDKKLRPLAAINRVIDEMAQMNKEANLPAANMPLFKDMVARWHANKNGFFDQWVSSESTNQTTTQGNMRDDPKVFGRSARGG